MATKNPPISLSEDTHNCGDEGEDVAESSPASKRPKRYSSGRKNYKEPSSDIDEEMDKKPKAKKSMKKKKVDSDNEEFSIEKESVIQSSDEEESLVKRETGKKSVSESQKKTQILEMIQNIIKSKLPVKNGDDCHVITIIFWIRISPELKISILQIMILYAVVRYLRATFASITFNVLPVILEGINESRHDMKGSSCMLQLNWILKNKQEYGINVDDELWVLAVWSNRYGQDLF
eukprot:scaffold8705_cov59-Cyclotella_meneghiniana.AAC.1